MFITRARAIFLFSLVALNALHASENGIENELEALLAEPTELKAEVGSRSGSKNTLMSNTPVDVVTYEQIERSGLTTLTDVMRYFVAGFNAPESSSMTDGSDHVRAFTLRGMSPDQVLVLINGKRVHTSSLLHINGTIGRGSSNVDLDTIAVKSIEKIEILRDGAAAQYGSDAIAGVINIILKGVGHPGSIGLSNGLRAKGDGRQLYTDGFVSIPLKYDGFANITLSAKDTEHTDRAGIDARAGVTPPRTTTKVGLPDATNYHAVLNIEAPQENDIVVYSNALFNQRDSKANAFYRAPNASAVLYPNGFLPVINAKISDFSATVGVQGSVSELFDFDISNSYGYNAVHFYINDTMNYTLGNASPTSFDNGSLKFIQNTTNLDLKKKLGALNLAGGAEYRYEEYQIKAGEIASYAGTAAQGLKGYRPENEVLASRNSYALYIDTKYALLDNLTLDAAMRHENFTDFGQTSNAKLALGYSLTPQILLRSSASTGFRAPSLAQSNYSYASSYTSSAGGIKIGGIFGPSHELSRYFGAKELKPETSKHFAFGAVYKPAKDTSLTIDYFYTGVADKIMLSNAFTTTASQQASTGISSVSFFTNAVDTRTQGVDIKLSHKFSFQNGYDLDSSIWYNYNDNKVVSFNDPNITRDNSFREIDKLENGQPKSSLKILNALSFDKFVATLNINWFDSYKDVPPGGLVAYTFDSTWTTDLDIAYKFSKNVVFAIGGNNVFDTHPSKWDGLSGAGAYYGYNGILPYSLYSPIGQSGAYYYARATIKF
jgi:iron complex outermembrane recepter protein